MDAKKPRSAKQKCVRTKGENDGFLAARATLIIVTKALWEVLDDEEAAKELERDAAIKEAQAAARRRRWTEEELAGERAAEAAAAAAAEAPRRQWRRSCGT